MAKDFFQGIGMKVVTGSLYLISFIGDHGAEATCLEETMEGWAALVRNLSGVDHWHLYTSHTLLQRSLQHEYGFVHKVATNIGDAFGPVEGSIQDNFLSDLF